MTSVLGLSMPKLGITKQDITSPKKVALGGIAATSLVGGGIIGAIKGSPLKGLAVGGVIAAAALGAALIGNASSSHRDGYCDYYGDPDCDYPGVTPSYRPPHVPHFPVPDPYYPRDDYPTGDYQGGTSWGDER